MTQEPPESYSPATPVPSSMSGVARGTAANLMGAAAMAAANLAVTFMVARRLDPDDAGVFFSSTSLFLLATALGMLGTNTGLVYFIARARALGRPSAIFSYFRAGLRPVLVVGCSMAVTLFVFAPQLAVMINSDYSADTTTYLRILAFFIPLAGLENATLAASRGLGSMRANVLVEQFGRSLLQAVFVGIAVVAATQTPWLLGVGWALPYLPAAVVAALWWRRQSRRAASRTSADDPPGSTASSAADGKPQQSTAREFWTFTGPRALGSVAQLVIQRLDVILVFSMAGPAQAAVYFAATRFLVVGQMGNRAISLAVQPRLASTLARGERAATNHFYQSSTAWLMVLTWPLYITLIIFAAPLLALFKEEYRTGALAVVILCSSMLIATLCGMVDMVLNMAGRTSWSLANVMVALGLNVGIDLWLIPTQGFLGAAIGWAVAIVAQNALALTQTGFILGLHPFGKGSLVAAIVNLVCFAATGALCRLILGSTLYSVLVTIVLGGALYSLALWRLRRTLQLDTLFSLRRAKKAAPR